MHRPASARPRRLAALALALVLAGAAGCGGDSEAGEDAETRERMGEIFGAMRVLLPLAADPGQLGDPRNRAWVGDVLDALSRNAFAVSSHAGGDVATRLLGSSLARDAHDARRFLDEGRPEAAGFLLLQSTDHCVACHSKLPSPGDSPLAAGFVEDVTLATLPLEQRASLLVATRRFDEALASYEALLAAPERHPAELLPALTDYLLVAIRVKGDFERPRRALERFEAREDLWSNLRTEVRSWVEALPELEAASAAEPGLERARAILRQAQSRLRFPADRRTLVHYVTASGVLQRTAEALRDDPDASAADRAEALYLLGLAESHLDRDAWVSEAPAYLEAAIRTEPRGPYAERAYALLEEEIVLGYTGSAGTNIPPDLADRLRELRELIGAV